MATSLAPRQALRPAGPYSRPPARRYFLPTDGRLALAESQGLPEAGRLVQGHVLAGRGSRRKHEAQTADAAPAFLDTGFEQRCRRWNEGAVAGVLRTGRGLAPATHSRKIRRFLPCTLGRPTPRSQRERRCERARVRPSPYGDLDTGGNDVGNLFAGKDMPDEARERTQNALQRVERANVDELLSRDLEVLVDEYAEPFEPATVRWDEVTMTEPKQVSSSGSDIFGHSIVRHEARTTARVPVDGDALMLTYRSHNGAPLYSSVTGTANPGWLELEWKGDLGAGPEAIKQWFEQHRTHVETFLGNNNRDTVGMNDHMRSTIRHAIERRRSQELQRRQLAASLPFPVERNPGAASPIRLQRKTVRVQQRPAPAPFTPEPELEQTAYEDILKDCSSMATVFERMPLATGTREEHLRNMLLGMLNTNFTGQVGGELFNGAGKTDILMRHGDRNLFIGECKFYKGPKSVTDALDQLLGYVVWRDTKASLILFVRDGNFTEVVKTANDTVAAHSQCQKQLSAPDRSRRSDFIFSRADDPGRAIHLALLPFKLTT